MVEIYDVDHGSPAYDAGIRRGDYLLRINGHDINDVLDYRFYIVAKKLALTIHRGPDILEPTVFKDEYADIGLRFRTFLMDEKQTCCNKCIFCFIDQQPPGLRDTLYLHDDDARLSFLMGNYITLTNLSETDITRIIKMKLSPLNVSVHTTNPELRVMMMNNRRAGQIGEQLRRFADAGISIKAQIVLCRGINDGNELTRTMTDLAELYPSITSVSVVPAGLTCHRDRLYPLRPYSSEECAAIIGQVTAFAGECLEKHGTRLFFCADELYVKAKLPIPREQAYEDYPQIENGVGLLRSMRSEFEYAISRLSDKAAAVKRSVSVATGVAAYDFICTLCHRAEERCPGLRIKVYKIENTFFGENVTVAGLLTGADIYEQLRDERIGANLLLPEVTLRFEQDMFLDSMTPAQLENKLNTKITFVPNDGAAFICALLGIKFKK